MAGTMRLLDVVRRCNSFYLPGSSRAECLPFIVDGVIVGSIRPDVLAALEHHPDVFACTPDRVSFAPSLNTPSGRSDALSSLLSTWRSEQRFWSTLKGWRNESYCVPSTSAFSSTPLFWLERAAVPIFGTLGLGVHINGYVRDPTSGDIKLWIARRSATKQTWPGFLDNFVAGGQPLGIGLMDNVVKECAEEAGVPEAIARKAVSTGAVSYYIELERGLTPETQYVFDLELSADFVPVPADGEVGEFYLWTVKETMDRIAAGEFKPNCALVLIHFLIQRGFITAESEPDYLDIIAGMSGAHRWDAVGRGGIAAFNPYPDYPITDEIRCQDSPKRD